VGGEVNSRRRRGKRVGPRQRVHCGRLQTAPAKRHQVGREGKGYVRFVECFRWYHKRHARKVTPTPFNVPALATQPTPGNVTARVTPNVRVRGELGRVISTGVGLSTGSACHPNRRCTQSVPPGKVTCVACHHNRKGGRRVTVNVVHLE